MRQTEAIMRQIGQRSKLFDSPLLVVRGRCTPSKVAYAA
jgi:hypothetical protein